MAEQLSMISTSKLEQNKARFREFHEANRHVWRLFRAFALRAAAVRDRYSCYAVFNRVRWEVEIETQDTDGLGLKVNNDFIPFYARGFHAAFPEHKGLFETRKLTTKDRPAASSLSMVCRDNAGDESELNDFLIDVLADEDA